MPHPTLEVIEKYQREYSNELYGDEYALGREESNVLYDLISRIDDNAYQRGKEEVERHAFWIGYDEGVDKQIAQEHLSPKEANEIYSSLTSVKTKE